MRIQPITTTYNNTSFKKMEMITPVEKWDLDVLEAVVKNAEIKEYVRHLNTLKKDLMLTYCTVGKNFFSVNAFTNIKDIKLLASAETKPELLEKLAKFNFQTFWNQQTEERAAKERRDLLLKEIDDFNSSLAK